MLTIKEFMHIGIRIVDYVLNVSQFKDEIHDTSRLLVMVMEQAGL